MADSIRVVIVDDHSIFRSGLRADLDASVDVVGEAADVVQIEVGLHDVPDVGRVEPEVADLVDGRHRRVDGGPGVEAGEAGAQPGGDVGVVGGTEPRVHQNQPAAGRFDEHDVAGQ